MRRYMLIEGDNDENVLTRLTVSTLAEGQAASGLSRSNVGLGITVLHATNTHQILSLGTKTALIYLGHMLE